MTMHFNSRTLVHFGVLAVLWGISSETIAADSEVSFNHDVRPILSDKCFHCHGPDATNQDSDFRLDTKENALADL